MRATHRDGIAAIAALAEPPGPPDLGAAYVRTAATLRDFLDLTAGARMTQAEVVELGDALEAWNARLADRQVEEHERLWGHWRDVPGRGQALVPTIADEVIDDRDGTHATTRATVRFGRFHVGENLVVHGGAVALLFDEFLGSFTSRAGMAPCRTAFLHTDYRSATPVGRYLTLHARVDRVEGRKRFASATLCDGERLCAEANGLWVELRPGQP